MNKPPRIPLYPGSNIRLRPFTHELVWLIANAIATGLLIAVTSASAYGISVLFR